MLVELKGALRHGAWSDWVAKNCEFSDRSAQGYMKIARECDPEKRNAVADLSLRATLKALATPSDKQTQRSIDRDSIESLENSCSRFFAKTFERCEPDDRARLIDHIESLLAQARSLR